VQIRTVADSDAGAKGRSSILRSLMSIDNKNSSISISEEELNFIPKGQMFFHSDGVVRSYTEKASNILHRFENLV
jgi:hypothetical protein